ncbi:MAG: site-2 protease family protein [Myxococcota bacterium]|nr:site-2 protease family protein [Myxococcota bacterium]
MSTNFSIFGIPVRVHGSFWLTSLLFGFLMFRAQPWAIAIWVPLMFLGILLHELGHALMVRRFGLPAEVDLVAMGGLTRFPAGRLSHWRSILVSFAGPAVGIVIGGIALACLWFGPALPAGGATVLWIVIFTNLGWALLNLLPIVPLDGGQIMSSILDRFFGMRGQRWARLISVVVACAIVAIAVRSGHYFMVFIVAMLAIENYRAWQMESNWSAGVRGQARARPSVAPSKEPEPLEAQLREGWSALEEGDAKRVRRIAETLVARARSDDDRYEVAHLLAWGRTLTGDPEGASEALLLLPRGKLPDALLEGTILLDLGRRREAVRPLTEAIVDRNDDFVATRLARAASGAARYDEVITLLGDRGKSEKVGARALQIVVNEAFYAGHHEPAARMFELLFERFGQASDAFNAACALGQAGRALEGIEWLRRAVEAGLADPTVLDTDDDLAPLRALPGYETLRAKAGLSA